MGYRLKILFSDGSLELVDDVFDTKEDAKDEFDSWVENWSAGRDTLKLAGEDYVEADIEDYEIFEE